MRLPADLVERAIQALRRGPLEAHELADILFPERAGRDLVAKRRSGHASGRDLIVRGVAVKQSDGTYALSPSVDLNGQPPDDGELEYEDGRVLRVRREVLGELPLPEPPPPPPLRREAPPQPQQAARPQWTPPVPPQYAPAAPQLTRQQLFEQYRAWCDHQAPAWAALNVLHDEVTNCRHQDGTPLDEWEYAQKWDELQRWNRQLRLQVYSWNRTLGVEPPDLQLERELGLTEPQRPSPRYPRPYAPARSPMRRGYAPSW